MTRPESKSGVAGQSQSAGNIGPRARGAVRALRGETRFRAHRQQQGFGTLSDPEGWPWEACVNLTGNSNGTWVIDRNRARMLLTLNKHGFLKHVGAAVTKDAVVAAPAAAPDEPSTAAAEPGPSAEDLNWARRSFSTN